MRIFQQLLCGAALILMPSFAQEHKWAGRVLDEQRVGCSREARRCSAPWRFHVTPVVALRGYSKRHLMQR